MTFSEDKLEQAVIELMQAEGFRYLSGKELLKEPHEVYKEVFEQAGNLKNIRRVSTFSFNISIIT